MTAPDPLAEASRLLAAGDPRGAAREAARVVRLTPESFRAQVILATAHARLAATTEPALHRLAEAAYRESARLVPNELQAHLDLVAAGKTLGKQRELRASYAGEWSTLPFARECLLAVDAGGPAGEWASSAGRLLRQPLVLAGTAALALAAVWLAVRPADSPGFPPPGGAPDTVALAALGGGSVSLADFRGKQVVILDFWATWCGPCRASMPAVEEVGRRYAAKGVQLLAVNLRESASDIGSFLGGRSDAPRVVLDHEGAWAARFGVRGIPTVVVLDRSGAERARFVGYSQDLGTRLAAALDQVL